MIQGKEAEFVQVNHATDQRNAGRDYYELLVPGSLELFMATRSGEELDRVALSNEHLFRHRFGFTANYAVRTQVLAIKQRYDMTDLDVRNICRSSQVLINHKEVRISPERFSPVFGWICLIAISYYCIGWIWLIEKSPTAPTWKMMLGISIIAALWGICAWGLKAYYIGPWRILKRTGALQQQSY